MGSPGLTPRQERVLSEIVRLLTPSYPQLDAATTARVQADVTTFVALRIAAMPSFLRVPYRIAITAFNLLPLLWRARRFVSLPATAQASYLALWSAARLGPMRDFVKLIRSCALLAYFDHPDVTQRLDAEHRPTPVVAAAAAVAPGMA